MSLAGFGAIEKYALAGQAIQLIDKIPDRAFVQTIQKNLAPNSRANALALLVHAAAMGLDRSTERALRAIVFEMGCTRKPDLVHAIDHILKMQTNRHL